MHRCYKGKSEAFLLPARHTKQTICTGYSITAVTCSLHNLAIQTHRPSWRAWSRDPLGRLVFSSLPVWALEESRFLWSTGFEWILQLVPDSWWFLSAYTLRGRPNLSGWWVWRWGWGRRRFLPSGTYKGLSPSHKWYPQLAATYSSYCNTSHSPHTPPISYM